MSTTTLQTAIDAVRSRKLSSRQLREYLSHRSPLVRANAIEIFAEHLSEDESLLSEIVLFATNPEHSFVLMGATTVAHWAVLSMLRSSCVAAREAGRELLRDWSEPERQDLIWFLRSEGIHM